MNRPVEPSINLTRPEILVVEASAGSGKTYALAKRYVQLLLLNARGGDPLLQPPFRPILALTFTNKAAFEMKRRILDFLQRIAFREMPADECADILAPTGLTAAEASALAAGAMEALIRNYNYFLVQNIDKFINALLVSCAFRVGLTANFRIKTNQSEYIEYALDGMIDSAGQDQGLRRLFSDFIDNYLYLENRSQWMPRDSILDILRNLFKVYDDHGLPFARQDVQPEDIIREKKHILSLLKDFSAQAPLGDLDGRFVKSLESFLDKHKDGFDFDSLSDYFAREDIPAKKQAVLSGSLTRQWDAIRTSIGRLAQLEVFCLYNPYLSIFEAVRGRYEEACRREDVLFLSELNRQAQVVFKSGITPEELYYRLAARFRHYLLDEFQDTSRLQWKNLRVLPEEALSSGGSLFYVGDKKQAIYAFRGGEAVLFDEVKQDFAVEKVRVETLAINWRSQQAVVEFNNAVFAWENLSRFVREKDVDKDGKIKSDAVGFSVDDLRAVSDIYSSAIQQHRPQKSGGYVRMEYVDAKLKEESLDLVRGRFLSLMGEVSKRFAWRDVAVLTRSNGELVEITRWLLEEGIPATSDQSSSIKEHPRVGEIVSLLRFLHVPSDNASFAEFLLGEIFLKASGLSAEVLRDFLLAERRKPTVQREPLLYLAFSRSFPSEWKLLIAEFLRDAGLYPLYELVVSVYARMKVLEFFPQAHGFLMHFLELVKNKEEEYFDVGNFLADFDAMSGDELYVRLSQENAVRLLTFHKAKGLEFPVVVLPFLTMKVEVGSGGADKKQAYVLREKGEELQFLRIKKGYGKYSDGIRELYEDEYKKNFLSELNIIYVALTRAVYELYGFIPSRAGNSRNLVRQLIPEDLSERGERRKYDLAAEVAGSEGKLLASERRNWLTFLHDEFNAGDDLASRGDRLEGEFYHAVLAQIKPAGQSDPLAVEEALRVLPPDAPCEEIKAGVLALLQQKSVQELLNAPGEVFTERDLVDRFGNTRRVDRMMVADRSVIVVDFKSSFAQRDSGVTQVRDYVEILRDIYPGRSIRGYLVFIREREVLEVD